MDIDDQSEMEISENDDQNEIDSDDENESDIDDQYDSDIEVRNLFEFNREMEYDGYHIAIDLEEFIEKQKNFKCFRCDEFPTPKQYKENLLCFYTRERNKYRLQIINYKDSQVIKSIKLKYDIMEFFICQDHRFIILDLQGYYFAVLDLLQNEDKIYKGQVICQQENKLLFEKDNKYYFLNIYDSENLVLFQPNKIQQRRWLRKITVYSQENFFIFNILNRQIIKFSLKGKEFSMMNYGRLNQIYYYSSQTNSLLIIFQLQYQRSIIHQQRLNHKIKIIRKMIIKNNQNCYKYGYQYGKKYLIFMKRNQKAEKKNFVALNIQTANSSIVNENKSLFIMTKTDELYLLAPQTFIFKKSQL